MYRLLALAVLAAACKSNPPPPPTPGSGSAGREAAAPDPCRTAKSEGPLAWIADDYPNALACAKKLKVPLVLDLWAPWCHTCLSMQTTVFLDKAMAVDANKFVFASLDTDKDVNAKALDKLAISAWPTFYVVNSADETVLSRFVGGATVGQFQEFLDAGALAVTNNIAAGDAHLLGGERALAVKDYATAETELKAALDVGPTAWHRRPEVLDSLLRTKWKRFDIKGCRAFAEQYMAQTGNTALVTGFLQTAMFCADAQKPTDDADAAAIKALREHIAARFKQLLADPAQLSVDDHTDAMGSLRDVLDALGDKAGAKATAEAERKLLDDAAAKAPTPLAAMTFNWPRADIYAYLDKPLELVPALEKSAQDLPKEYDPRARLGWIYYKAKQYDAAAKWTDEALAMVYGPRKGRLLAQRADIAAAAGDKAKERTLREQAVHLYETLPASQANPDALAKAKQALAALDAGSAAR